MNDRSGTLSRPSLLRLPPERVWKALTDPDDVKEYFLGTNVASTWREGDPVTFAGEWKGKAYEDKGVVLENRPNVLLRISHYSPLTGLPDVPENYHTVEYRLDPRDEGTGSQHHAGQQQETKPKRTNQPSSGTWCSATSRSIWSADTCPAVPAGVTVARPPGAGIVGGRLFSAPACCRYAPAVFSGTELDDPSGAGHCH